jgi:hypothetical protein
MGAGIPRMLPVRRSPSPLILLVQRPDTYAKEDETNRGSYPPLRPVSLPLEAREEDETAPAPPAACASPSSPCLVAAGAAH